MNNRIRTVFLACCHIFILLFFSIVLTTSADAGPLSLSVKKTQIGKVNNGKQSIVFHFTVKNTSDVEYISKLNSVTLELTGDIGNGRKETYQRNVDINYVFKPVLEPGHSKNLKTEFKRKVNPAKGWFPYKNVRIRILKYNFKRTS